MGMKTSTIQKITRARQALEESIIDAHFDEALTQPDIEIVSEKSKLSVQEIKRILSGDGVTIDKIKRVLEFIEDGEVATYGDVAFAIGFPNHYRTVANILSKEIHIEALAAPIIKSSSVGDFIIDPKFKTFGGYEDRSPYLSERKIKHNVRGDGKVAIKRDQHVNGEELKRRIAAA